MINDFNYLAPKTLEEALTLLDKYQDDCKVIAGGQSLLILMRQGLVAPEYLVDIVRKVVEGGRPVVEQMLSPGLASRVLAEFESWFALNEQFKYLLIPLSPDETKVLRCIAAGNSLEQAAVELSSDNNTVRHQLAMIIDKMVANDRSLAVLKAIEKGLPSIVSRMITSSGLGKEYLSRKEFTAFKASLTRRLRPFVGKSS